MRNLALGLTMALLAGCTHTPAGPAQTRPPQTSSQGLSNTSWKLVHFQAPDGRAVVPPNVEDYTIHFGGDGSLALQLDCATGHWEKPASPDGGALTLKGGALTGALCPAGAIDTQLAADLDRVRSFAIAGSQLTLVLDAGAGTYVWERKAGGA